MFALLMNYSEMGRLSTQMCNVPIVAVLHNPLLRNQHVILNEKIDRLYEFQIHE